MQVRGPKSGFRRTIPFRQKLRRELTPAEKIFWHQVGNRRFYNLKFRRQHGIGPYIVDFYCPERLLVVEIDGDTHAGDLAISKDSTRTQYIQKFGYFVVRYTNREVIFNINGVLEDLAIKLKLL
jgi:very-short-patch-repair endonuclease